MGGGSLSQPVAPHAVPHPLTMPLPRVGATDLTDVDVLRGVGACLSRLLLLLSLPVLRVADVDHALAGVWTSPNSAQDTKHDRLRKHQVLRNCALLIVIALTDTVVTAESIICPANVFFAKNTFVFVSLTQASVKNNSSRTSHNIFFRWVHTPPS